ncbi:PREDICTED: uncharacterized protein LOC108546002 [Eufriesea mexicana]|uniref:uncharacterized protein LOC108546002 n=1 Tax=Eufriesea mexicana TaxID=516756 RepID=UPI00083C6CE7|nr:PREDICTED: uncharacterized protein LOC108546002 [Eufriesea mexicana]XP_017753397.1 PREDICTED: uncharacterized protein LOC108546002 [Eufriesea mexicana]XP_017753398.1 PREDICTED: uncharacterized protein LOC108546002 [Eufriesea mexicana]
MFAVVNYYTATVLFALVHRSFSAMVLPRPPSSQNYIQRFDRKGNEQKLYEGKSLQSFLQNPNMERANTNDYSLVEIELQSPNEMDVTSLQDIVHAMLKQSEQVHNDSYPNPEVVPHSIFGVRDVGLTPNFKINAVNEERHVLIRPSKFQNVDEKLYYLKNGRPKVYVNVRGRSGSFRKDVSSRTTSSNEPVEFLRMTPPVHRPTDWKTHHDKIIRPLKKFEHQTNTKREYQKRFLKNEAKKLSRLAIVYGLDDSTTENSMVTSSELPKQIPAPPSKFPSRTLMAQTTPVQKYALKRTNILPEYSYPDIS